MCSLLLVSRFRKFQSQLPILYFFLVEIYSNCKTVRNAVSDPSCGLLHLKFLKIIYFYASYSVSSLKPFSHIVIWSINVISLSF